MIALAIVKRAKEIDIAIAKCQRKRGKRPNRYATLGAES